MPASRPNQIPVRTSGMSCANPTFLVSQNGSESRRPLRIAVDTLTSRTWPVGLIQGDKSDAGDASSAVDEG